MRLKHACAVALVVWTLGSFSWAARGEDRIPSRLRAGRDAAWVKRSKFRLDWLPRVDFRFHLMLQSNPKRAFFLSLLGPRIREDKLRQESIEELAKSRFSGFLNASLGEPSVSRLFDRSRFQHAADVIEEVSMEAWNGIASNKFVSWAKAEQERLWDLVLQHLPDDFITKPSFSDPYLLEAGLCLRLRDALLPTCLSKLGRG
ncbi:MAG: hypothetical protein AAF471_05985 [Myxococcota bacterium]